MVISVVNQKGGVGKTTIAVNLAVCFAKAKKDVLLIDADKQGSSLSFSTIRSELDTVKLPKYDFEQVLKPELHEMEFTHDLTLIDVGGSDGDVFRSGIYASDVIIMPLTPSSLDVWGSELTLQIIDDANAYRKSNKKPPIRIYGLLNMVLPSTTLTADIREVASDIAQDYNIGFLKTELGMRVVYKRVINSGLGVIEAKDPKAFEEMKSLYKEVKQLWQK